MNNCPGEVITTKSDTDGHWITCVIKIDNVPLILVNIYGYNNEQKNKNLLYQITTVLKELQQKFSSDHILVGGDFNLTPDEWLDRWPTKYNHSHPNRTLDNFIKQNKLVDLWREQNGNRRQYTWMKPNGQIKSRIDYWLMSNSVSNYICHIKMSGSPLTDHCIVNLEILYCKKMPKQSKDYWKFNSNLLYNKEYCSNVSKIILDIQNDESLHSAVQKWEFLKFSIRKYSISFSKKLKREKLERETHLINAILSYYNKMDWSEEDREKILQTQSKLDELYLEKAQGAYVRSRAKWIEEGEKSSAYFCRLEKQRQINNSVSSLLINGKECSDSDIISKCQCFTGIYINLHIVNRKPWPFLTHLIT